MKLRTLVRVERVTDLVYLVVPGWNPHETFWVMPGTIPFPVQEGDRFFARAHLDARTPRELALSDYERP